MHDWKGMRGACLGITLLAAAMSAEASGVWADQAWIRLLPGDLPAAGYFTLHNDTAQSVRLVNVQSPAYGEAMMHRSDSGRMAPVNSVTVPPHGQARFQPGGYHVMFMQAKGNLAPGRHIPGQLFLAGGQRVPVDFVAKGATGQ